MSERCPKPEVGLHSWRFDGDDPYILCVYCGERRDALSGRHHAVAGLRCHRCGRRDGVQNGFCNDCGVSVTRSEMYRAVGLNECPNGPDDEGLWPCDPKGYFGVAECQTCGRTGTWAAAGCPPPESSQG